MTNSIEWWAPEILVRNSEFNNKTDVWSFGITIWQVFNNGKKPFESQRPGLVSSIYELIIYIIYI